MDAQTATTGRSRVYVDMVGDLFHAGHVALLKAARDHGDWLVVGVLGDEAAEVYKRRPIMTLAERVAVVEACRYVDEVVADAPLEVDEDFLTEHEIATVVHGDDLSPQAAEAVYGPAVAAGRLRYVPRTTGISTTELIRRVLDANAAGVPAGRPLAERTETVRGGGYVADMAYTFQVVVDCREPHELADWWAETLGWEVEEQDEAFIRRMVAEGRATEDDTTTYRGRLRWRTAVAINSPDGGAPRVLFQQAPETKTVKNRLHLDVRTGDDDPETVVERLLARGATRLWEGSQGPQSWTTMADPEGNEFCV